MFFSFPKTPEMTSSILRAPGCTDVTTKLLRVRFKVLILPILSLLLVDIHIHKRLRSKEHEVLKTQWYSPTRNFPGGVLRLCTTPKPCFVQTFLFTDLFIYFFIYKVTKVKMIHVYLKIKTKAGRHM